MIGKVLKSLLSDAYDAWYNDQLAGETYKELAENNRVELVEEIGFENAEGGAK